MIGVGVIGYGYWGPNLVRNFYETKDVKLVAVSDLRIERLRQAQARYPTIKVMEDHRSLIDDPEVDLVVIATPVSTHFGLAMQALEAGKHVMVEKPLASTSEQVLRLMAAADKAKRLLFVDHTFVHTGAVRKIRQLIDDGTLGDIYYYDSARVNLGLFQHDVNVIWDLAVHDLSIMDYVLPTHPIAVSATGMSHVPGEPENVAFLTLFFDTALISHIHVNWLAPVKVRRTLIGASQKMIVYDDLEQSEKIKVYDKGLTLDRRQDPEKVYQALIGYRTGDMVAPNLDMTEALKREADHIVKCINGNDRPVADGRAGFRVVEILEAATESMRAKGRPVELASAKRGGI